MKLEWSLFALADREANLDYTALDSPKTAIRLDKRIERATDMLTAFPESGRIGRAEGTRELVVGGTPYIVAYKIKTDSIHILRVLHMSQLWPDDLL